MSVDPLTAWLLILGAGLVAFITRAVFILPGKEFRLSPGLRRILGFAPAAALSAIIAPDIAMSGGMLALSADNARLLAGLLGVAVALATRSVLITVIAGMIALIAARVVLGAH